MCIDGVSEHAASPSGPTGPTGVARTDAPVYMRVLTHVHRCIGSRHGTRQILPTSPKLTHLSVYDRRDCVSDSKKKISEYGTSPSVPSSLTHVHR